MKFSELALEEWIISALEKNDLFEATDIQAAVINKILTNKNIIARSQTGSGKTFAFGLPLFVGLDLESKGVERLIVCPTRELALQVTDELRKVADKGDIIIAPVYGGSDIGRQIAKVKKSKIVVGTPGRIIDHIKRRTLRLKNVKTIVLDEADEMLDMGFKGDVEKILSECPDDVQKLMFSATFSKEVKELAKTYMQDSEVIEIGNLQPVEIEQSYVITDKNGKFGVLEKVLQENEEASIIIFANTKAMVQSLYDVLRDNYKCALLHGDMKQNERKNMLSLFKKKSVNILIATDVAARGIDIKGLDVVINYDLPQMDEYYIHRIGRTARAGKSGVAITILNTSEQIRRIKVIENKLGVTISEKVVKQKRIDVEKIKEKLFDKYKVEKKKDAFKKDKKRLYKSESKNAKNRNKTKNKRVKHEKSFSDRRKQFGK